MWFDEKPIDTGGTFATGGPASMPIPLLIIKDLQHVTEYLIVPIVANIFHNPMNWIMLISIAYRAVYGAKRWEPFVIVVAFTLISIAAVLPWGGENYNRNLSWPTFDPSIFYGKVCLGYFVYAACRFTHKRSKIFDPPRTDKPTLETPRGLPPEIYVGNTRIRLRDPSGP